MDGNISSWRFNATLPLYDQEILDCGLGEGMQWL
jgi:hypothetical protein